MDAIITSAALVLALFAIVRGLGPPDILLLGATVLVTIFGVITPEQAFLGFSNKNVLMIGALFVVAAGVRETGMLNSLSRKLLGTAKDEKSALSRLAPLIATMSAFLNNTPLVALSIPIVREWSRQRKVALSRVLMPVSFFAVLGSTCTLIGTSTNLVVNGMMSDWAIAQPETAQALMPLSLFELGKAGFFIAIAGCLYLLFFGRKLLPTRHDLIEDYGHDPRQYTVDLRIETECPLIGKSVEEAGLRHLEGLFLIAIQRNESVISPVTPETVLQQGDQLTFSGVVTSIVELEKIRGLLPLADDGYISQPDEKRHHILSECVISDRSPLIGVSIRDADFRARYNAAVIAVHRGGSRISGRIGDIVLQAGDTLLVQSGRHFERANRHNPDFFLVSSVTDSRPFRYDRAKYAGAIMVGFIFLLLSDFIDNAISAFLAAGLMIATRCISAAEARQSINWSVLITIGAAIGLGNAVSASGLATFFGNLVVSWTHIGGAVGALAAVYLLTMVLSELVTNSAAAAIAFPLSMQVALLVGADPRPFAIAVAIAASCCFASPLGYQTHLLVFGPGGYQFKDFMRVGLPLDVIAFAIAMIVIPLAWPL